MKQMIMIGTCALWAVVTCAWGYSYVAKGLAAPGAIGYETQWNVQLFFFAITRLPVLTVVLGAILWIEAKFLPSASLAAPTKSENTSDSRSGVKEDRSTVILAIRVVSLLYGIVGAGFAVLLLSFLSTYGVTYSVQTQYLLIGAAMSLLTMYGFLRLRPWGRLLAIALNGLYVLVFLLGLSHRYPAVAD